MIAAFGEGGVFPQGNCRLGRNENGTRGQEDLGGTIQLAGLGTTQMEATVWYLQGSRHLVVTLPSLLPLTYAMPFS